MATVRITIHAHQEFERLPTPVQGRVLGIYERLAKWPAVSGVKALTGKWAGHYRIRTGDYRVIYRVDRQTRPVIVTIIKVAHRKEIY